MRSKDGEDKWVAILLVSIVMSISFATAPSTAEDFVKVSLPHDISIELAKTWVVLSGTQRTALDSFSEKVLDLSRIDKPISELSFAANYLDERGDVIGILNIRYYPQVELTQDNARQATEKEIKEIDAAPREAVVKLSKEFGMRVSSWGGTKKVNINGITVFLTEYQMGSADGAREFRVRLARVFAAPRSFTLTVSYLIAASHLLLPVTDRIINSLRMEGVGPSVKELERIVDEHGEVLIGEVILDRLGSMTIQVGNEFRVMLGRPARTYVNRQTLVADLRRMNTSREHLLELIARKKSQMDQEKLYWTKLRQKEQHPIPADQPIKKKTPEYLKELPTGSVQLPMDEKENLQQALRDKEAADDTLWKFAQRNRLTDDMSQPEKPKLTAEPGGSREPSIMAELYGEQWGLVLVISLLVTWAIGLTPPLLIRFVFMRRPMARRWAIPVVLLFYFFNFWLFISVLGSEKKKHYAIALIAMVSYGILRRGGKRPSKQEEAPTATEANLSGQKEMKDSLPLTEPANDAKATLTKSQIELGPEVQIAGEAKHHIPTARQTPFENRASLGDFPFPLELQRRVFDFLLKEEKRDDATMLQARVLSNGNPENSEAIYYKLAIPRKLATCST